MFVQDIERGLRLFDGNEFLRSLGYSQQNVAILTESRMHTLRTFSGLICGGGGMLGDCLELALGIPC